MHALKQGLRCSKTLANCARIQQVLAPEEAEVKPVIEPTFLYLPHCESEFTASVMRTFGAAPACIASTAVLGTWSCLRLQCSVLYVLWFNILNSLPLAVGKG